MFLCSATTLTSLHRSVLGYLQQAASHLCIVRRPHCRTCLSEEGPDARCVWLDVPVQRVEARLHVRRTIPVTEVHVVSKVPILRYEVSFSVIATKLYAKQPCECFRTSRLVRNCAQLPTRYSCSTYNLAACIDRIATYVKPLNLPAIALFV